MTWFTRLLSMETPENTTLQAAELSFRGFLPWWLAIFFVILFGAVAFFFYFLDMAKIGPVRRSLLAFLRTAAIALLVVLLFRPVLLADFGGARARPIVLLLDNSRSMQLQDRRLSEPDRRRVAIARGLLAPELFSKDARLPAETPQDPSRLEMVHWVLSHEKLKLIDNLEKKGPLVPFLFGQRLHPQEKDNPLAARLLKTLKGNESKTALADAIYEILQRKDADSPAAIVVISDGQDNASKFTLEEAAREAARWTVPLHIYGVGSAEGGALQLKEVPIPSTIFFDDTVAVPISWRAQGFAKGEIEITLTLGGRVVARKDLPVQKGDDLRTVLAFTPEKSKDKEQDLDLVASIRLKGNDHFKDSLIRKVRLVDSRIKVLYIEGSPRFEFKFLQPVLLRDRRVKVNFLLTNADPQVLQSGAPFLPAFPVSREKFFEEKFNLIILGDVAPDFLGRERMEWIRDFVKDRGGLIVIAGRQHLPSAYENTPLAEVFPVEFPKGKVSFEDRPQEYHPILTDAGKRAGMLALADTLEDNLKLWQKLPGFYWSYPVVKPRPGATSLLVNPRSKMDKADMQPAPIMVSQFYGKGQVLLLTTDEIWRWRYNAQDKYYARFWGQVTYQMGLPHLLGDHARRVQVALERSQAVVDTPSSIFVRLLDKDFQPRKDKKVEAVLEYLEGKQGPERSHKIVLQAIPGRDGEYRALLANNQPGRFALKINNPEPANYYFRVDLPPGHELEEVGLAEKTLREAARISGGRFYREEDLHQLVPNLPGKTVHFQRHQEIVLWNPLVFLLLVALVSAEWIIRKFANMS